MIYLNFIFEKFLSVGCWEEIKEYNDTNYDEVKKDIEKQLGKCNFSVTDIDSVITNVKPFSDESEYRIICIGVEQREVIYST